jgi:hypothetical protein
MNKIPEDMALAIAADYDAGMPVTEIAARNCVSRSTVYRILRDRPVTQYRNSDRASSLAAVIRAWEDGLDCCDTATSLGFSEGWVRQLLHEAGIEPKDRNRYPFVPEECPIEIPDEVWAAEFRGFFYADGCATFVKHHKGLALTPTLTISQRADNCGILEEIRSVLGGNLGYRSYDNHPMPNAKPQWKWTAKGWSRVLAIIEATDLDRGILPAKKVEDVIILYEAVQARLTMPFKCTEEDWAVIHQYEKELRAVKKYQL